MPVIGGEPSDVEGVGALLVDGGLVCSGTLIAPDVVLTAAHCLLDAVPAYAEDAPVAGRCAMTHPLFREPRLFEPGLGDVHDLGLLWLEAPVSSSTVQLADDAAQLEVGLEVTIVGYGVTWIDQRLAEGCVIAPPEDDSPPSGTAPAGCDGGGGGAGILPALLALAGLRRVAFRPR